ncbi:hypothetical protein [Mucilaginibacter ginkgonis]|uniref:Response regulatory domain-containing protein n=1 Tax=Mucilaginibacter ginkgonis TaxID=2682091 RepID=A0A7T7FD89_9SPHI|nr:hypothetical protein [Mucilaginibacter ginkgonis]QQL51224.1 hypothetical protein GO620_007190 [Mucilaginibacter ginkgonis]
MPKRVLLLGSDLFLSNLLADVFNISDFEVYKCVNFSTAADLISKKNFDYFLTDREFAPAEKFFFKGFIDMTHYKKYLPAIMFYSKNF